MSQQKPKWHVVIEFMDGAYEGDVIASDKDTAYTLALQDARMAGAGITFYGPVVAKFITKSE